MTTLSGNTLSVSAGALRVVLAGVAVSASMVGLAAVGLFISTLTDTPVAAMAATAVVALMSQLLDTVPQLSGIHGILLTHYWFSFGDLMRSPIFFDNVWRNAGLQVGYMLVFGLGAWARMTTRDVLA